MNKLDILLNCIPESPFKVQLEVEITELRQQLVQQPSVDVLVDALREINHAADINGDYYICKLVDKAINEAKPIEKDVK